MKAPRTRIARIVADKTLKSGVSKQYAREVAAYLLAEGRTGELDSLLRDVSADWAERGYVEAIARSAYPLSETVKNTIGKQVAALFPEAKQVVVTDVLDPSLIGGVQVSVANQQLDLSVEAKLNKFKQLVRAGKD